MIPITRPDPLHTQIYSLIKQRLLEGYYEPGERLVEVRLADELGVSRGPVRESLRMLIQDGLVIQNGSILHVFQPTLQDMIDIYQCRQGLESLAARLAAPRISEDKIDLMFRTLEESEAAMVNQDRKRIVDLNILFHETIYEASGNNQLISLNRVIRDKVTYLRNCNLKKSLRDQNFLAEHLRIAEALKDRDEIRAEREMQNHIGQDLQALAMFYENKGE